MTLSRQVHGLKLIRQSRVKNCNLPCSHAFDKALTS